MLIAAVLGLAVLGDAAAPPKTAAAPGVIQLQTVPRRPLPRKGPKVTCAIRVLQADPKVDERMVRKLGNDVDPRMARPSACED